MEIRLLENNRYEADVNNSLGADSEKALVGTYLCTTQEAYARKNISVVSS